MKRNFIYAVLAVLALSATSVQAQKLTKKFSFGFGLEAGAVTGEVKEIYNITGGITVRASYKVGPGFATLTSGGVILFPKSLEGEDLKAGLVIPIKAGYKFIIQDHFFVMGELGYSSVKTYFDNGTSSPGSYSEGGFTYAPAIGVQFGAFEISARYESTALTGGNLSAAMARIGFNF